jgi:hypothetical protein
MSQKMSFPLIPANPGSGPGQAPESRYFRYLKILWAPVSTGVTTLCGIIMIHLPKRCGFLGSLLP